ncbi:MAG: hypothetical protein EB127_06570 [Alphaproteobacteria bacterium]|nr:hypothetical protein [Alphaproteobacteria bacterium]
MGQKTSRTVATVPIYTTYANYRAAGILFANSTVALAGVQKHRRLADMGGIGTLSGLGGRRESTDIDWCHTAWREVIEELYNETDIPTTLIMDLRKKIPVRTEPTYYNEYVMFRLTFEDLEYMLRICAKPKYGIHSVLYEKLPENLSDLIIKRLPVYDTEIGALSLLPCAHPVQISEEFMTDIAATRA